MKYQEPLFIYRHVVDEMQGIPSDKLFNDSTHEKLREKWCASAFGIGYAKYVQPCRIAVNESRENLDIDFILEVVGKSHPFQITEIMEKGRTRGKEYKEQANDDSKAHPYRPELGKTEGPSWIGNAIAKKVDKHYAGSESLNLLVYVNFTARELEIDRIRAKAIIHRGKFSSIWLLTNSLIGSLFPNEQLGEIEGWGEIGLQ